MRDVFRAPARPASGTPRISRTRHRRNASLSWGLAIALASSIAACGGDDPQGPAASGDGAGSSSGPAQSAPEGSATIISRDIPGFEVGLATNDRRPVYVLTGDSIDSPTCVDACLKDFPPVEPEGAAATAGPDVDADKLETFTRPDGTKQAAFDGQPLYSNSGKGLLDGQGVKQGGGTFYIFSPDGDAITASPPAGY